MPAIKPPLSRTQRQLADTEGMTRSEIESYILSIDGFVTAELAARYLSGSGREKERENKISAQGVRICMRNGELPIGLVSGHRCDIIPERLVRWKNGTLGVNSDELTKELTKALGSLPVIITDLFKSAVTKLV